jgi:hypothetical protein
MTVVRIGPVRKNARRLQDSMSGLIDDGSHVVREKLNEAADILQGSMSQLLEDGEELMRAKLVEAAALLRQTRRQAEVGAKEALEIAQVQAERSYGGLRKLAFRRPVATAAAALGVGLAVGLILRGRRAQAPMAAAKRQAEDKPVRKPGKGAHPRKPARRDEMTLYS